MHPKAVETNPSKAPAIQVKPHINNVSDHHQWGFTLNIISQCCSPHQRKENQIIMTTEEGKKEDETQQGFIIQKRSKENQPATKKGYFINVVKRTPRKKTKLKN